MEPRAGSTHIEAETLETRKIEGTEKVSSET